MEMRGHGRVVVLLALLATLLVIGAALAQAGAETAGETPCGEGAGVALPEDARQEPYTWEQIATMPGAIAATLLIVQFFKLPLDRVRKIPTRYLALAIAFALMAGAQAATRGLTLRDLPLLAINAIVVTLAAMGAYEISFRKLERK